MSKKINLSQISKRTKMIAAVMFAVGVSAAGVGITHAASNTFSTGNQMSFLVNAISQKFNLNSTDVQTVVDQVMADQRAQMEADHEKEFASRLAEAVTSGSISQAQSDAIVAKQKEVKSFMDSLSGKTEPERKAAVAAEMASLKQWATDNGIDQKYAMFLRGRGHFGVGEKFGGPHGEEKNTGAADSTENATTTN